MIHPDDDAITAIAMVLVILCTTFALAVIGYGLRQRLCNCNASQAAQE